MHAKIDYELGKPVFEPLQSDDCIELRMYKLITAASEGNGAPLNEELTQEIIRHYVVKKRKFMPKIRQNAFGGRATQTPRRNEAYI